MSWRAIAELPLQCDCGGELAQVPDKLEWFCKPSVHPETRDMYSEKHELRLRLEDGRLVFERYER